MTPEKLDELYALAKREEFNRAISGGLISKEYRQATYPILVTALIDRVRELETLAGRIDETMTNYERMGEICSFEGQPMIYASVLEELSELARAALNKESK